MLHNKQSNSYLPRIHCDENIAAWVKSQVNALKDESFDPARHSSLDDVDLLAHHRQHFQLDTVKLIETSPSTTLGETLWSRQITQFEGNSMENNNRILWLYQDKLEASSFYELIYQHNGENSLRDKQLSLISTTAR